MLVNQSLTTATLSLFRPQATSAEQPAKISSEPSRMAKTADMSGFYSAPTVATVPDPVLSEQTQKVLDTIASLVANEVAAVNRGTKALWSSQPGRDIPLDTDWTDLSVQDRMLMGSMGREANRADNLNNDFSISASLAGEMNLKGRGFIGPGARMDMSRDELIEDTIDGMVTHQINHIKRAFEMAADPEV